METNCKNYVYLKNVKGNPDISNFILIHNSFLNMHVLLN